jgi:hypothetical protein
MLRMNGRSGVLQIYSLLYIKRSLLRIFCLVQWDFWQRQTLVSFLIFYVFPVQVYCDASWPKQRGLSRCRHPY